MVLATANPDKAAEIVALVTDTVGDRVELVARPSSVGEVEETGDTLEDNARLKAMALVEATGLPAIADDTGLEVDALGGAPGVFSSRYSGEHASYDENVAKLLGELDAAGASGPERAPGPVPHRGHGLFPGGREVAAHGVVEGTIARERRGQRWLRIRPGLRPRRRGRPHLRRDVERREERPVAPGPGVSGPGHRVAVGLSRRWGRHAGALPIALGAARSGGARRSVRPGWYGRGHFRHPPGRSPPTRKSSGRRSSRHLERWPPRPLGTKVPKGPRTAPGAGPPGSGAGRAPGLVRGAQRAPHWRGVGLWRHSVTAPLRT